MAFDLNSILFETLEDAQAILDKEFPGHRVFKITEEDSEYWVIDGPNLKIQLFNESVE